MGKSAMMCALVGTSAAMAPGAMGDEDPSLGIQWEVEHQGEDVVRVGLMVDSGAVVGREVAQREGRYGQISEHRPVQVSVWETEIAAPGSGWVRVDFGEVDLTSATDGQRGSYIRVTSLHDGHEQYFDSRSLRAWGNTSAYFNGDAVRVELMSAPNSSGADRVRIDGLVGGGAALAPNSICGTVDDRELSGDPRAGRLMPEGCTAWLIGDQGSTFLTAGHCNARGGQVVQFNVPMSNAGGGYRHPAPMDQYVVDHPSVQTSGSNTHLGNDWAFFAVRDNTETGLTPLEAQGDSFGLATSRIGNDGRPLRVTGYGIVGYPVDPAWNGVQKTHVGSMRGYSGNLLKHTADTTGGNSGGPVIDETTGLAVAIHTNAGCGTGGGNNHACDILNANLQHALANPTGSAVPEPFEAYAASAPAFVNPDGGSVLGFEVVSSSVAIQDGPWLVFDAGSGEQRVAMHQASAGSYEAALPELACGSEISYRFEVTAGGEAMVFPEDWGVAPMRTVALDALAVGFGDDFETDRGWEVVDGGAGAWTRTQPTVEIGIPKDGDGSGKCYFATGASTLVSPRMVVEDAIGATVSMVVWVGSGSSVDIELSNDGGEHWAVAETIGTTGGWVARTYVINDYMGTTGTVMVRATAGGDGAAGVDGFTVSSRVCGVEACPADINADGYVDFQDVMFFQQKFLARDAVVDLNEDGSVDFMDVSSFLRMFTTTCK